MMREIKFRAWCERDSEWRYGFYITDEKEHEILTKLDSGVMYASTIKHEDVESIGQYTNLKDKHGVEIYEGDIVYVVGLGNCLVKWEESDACWLFEQPEEAYGYQDVLEDLDKVIGNIYENPTLMEDK